MRYTTEDGREWDTLLAWSEKLNISPEKFKKLYKQGKFEKDKYAKVYAIIPE